MGIAANMAAANPQATLHDTSNQDGIAQINPVALPVREMRGSSLAFIGLAILLSLGCYSLTTGRSPMNPLQVFQFAVGVLLVVGCIGRALWPPTLVFGPDLSIPRIPRNRHIPWDQVKDVRIAYYRRNPEIVEKALRRKQLYVNIPGYPGGYLLNGKFWGVTNDALIREFVLRCDCKIIDETIGITTDARTLRAAYLNGQQLTPVPTPPG
jgi:hypothetical protein